MDNSVGSLELVIGCMFSGKSTELIRRTRMNKMLNKNVLVVNHASDLRYGNSFKITSHDMDQENAVHVTSLMTLIQKDEYLYANVVIVDEGQFFNDLVEFSKKAVEQDDKTLIIAALDGNFNRQPFQNVMELIPFADNVIRLNAMCFMCNDGSSASFTKRIKENTSKNEFDVVVGGSDIYQSVCRRHYKQ